VVWVCEQHNLVNQSLGKPEVACSLPWLDERWRDGKPSCWGGEDQSARESLGHGGGDDDTREDEADASKALLGRLEAFERS